MNITWSATPHETATPPRIIFAEHKGDLLRDPWTPPARIPLFHVDDGRNDFVAGPLGARLHRSFGREEPTILPLYQRSMKAQQR